MCPGILLWVFLPSVPHSFGISHLLWVNDPWSCRYGIMPCILSGWVILFRSLTSVVTKSSCSGISFSPRHLLSSGPMSAFSFFSRLFGLWSSSSHFLDCADVRAQLSVLLACHFSWPPSSWRGFLLLVASESVPDIFSGRMWGPLSPIVLWLLRSMISVDTFFVTVLGPPVLTDLRYHASCFVAVYLHHMDQTLLTFLLLSTLALLLIIFTFLFFFYFLCPFHLFSYFFSLF